MTERERFEISEGAIERKKEAAEKLRQLLNSDCRDDEIEICISYDICLSKA